MISKCDKFGSHWVKVIRALVLILRWTLLELLHLQEVLCTPRHPNSTLLLTLPLQALRAPGLDALPVHAGTCSPFGLPAPPLPASHWLSQTPTPKLHQSPQRGGPLNSGACWSAAITARRTSRGGSSEVARCEEFPRSCRPPLPPPPRSSAAGNCKPQPGTRARPHVPSQGCFSAAALGLTAAIFNVPDPF